MELHSKIFLFLLVLVMKMTPAMAQPDVSEFKNIFRLENNKTVEEIKVDGVLDEATWQQASIATDFWQKTPYFAKAADPRTEVRFTYDEDNLYMAAKCVQSSDIVIQTLKRDEFWDNDGIAMILDPLNTRTNAFLFGVSAAGVQWDAQYAPNSGINSDWSNKWRGEVKVYDGYWTAEIAIPFKILRYNDTNMEWGMNIVRGIQGINEFHNWTAVPESFWPPNPAFAGALVWDAPPTKKSGNFNIIPYVTGSVNKNNGEDAVLDGNAGLDARFALTSTLNADVTINPDFSQIEVDELVTNLTRFSIFLPEKRTFFLENSDIFGNFGIGPVTPFFSRRIGLDENGQAVPLLYGVRATGNLTDDVRVGVMNTHTGKSDSSPSLNQTAVAAQKQFGLSNIKGLFVSQQAFDDFDPQRENSSKNVSLEGLFKSSDGKRSIWAGAHQSFKDGFDEKTGFYNLGGQYQNSEWNTSTNMMIVQENYFTDLGFNLRVNNFDAIRDTSIRVGFNQWLTTADYTIRPKEGKIQRHNIGFENQLTFNPDWSFNERNNSLNYFLRFSNTSEVNVGVSNNEVELLLPFSFVSDGEPLPSGRYNFTNFEVGYDSDGRKLLQYSASAQLGEFYNGTLNRFTAGVNYRIQPWANFGVEYQFNKFNFPNPHGEELITALLSKIEIGFSRNLIWTTLFQFVDQSDFMGINSRLQWRFAPQSDLFLVYIDNYDVIGSEINTSNRAIALKINYWY